MKKSADAYRSIGEVAKLIGVAPHVLRYWETQFPQLAPVKRADGRRYYRLDDVRLAAGLAEVMREEGLTTRGAAKLIAQDKGATVRERGLRRLPPQFGGAAPDAEPAKAAATRTPAPRRTGSGKQDGSAARELPLFGASTAPQTTLQPITPASGEWLARLASVSGALRGSSGRRLPAAALQRLHGELRRLLEPRA